MDKLSLTLWRLARFYRKFADASDWLFEIQQFVRRCLIADAQFEQALPWVRKEAGRRWRT